MNYKEFTATAQAGRVELKNIVKNPNRIIDTLNNYFKFGGDLTAIDEDLTTDEFSKVGDVVSTLHTYPEAFSRSLLRRDHLGRYIKYNDTPLSTLGYIANNDGDVNAYTVDVLEEIPTADLTVTEKRTVYTKQVTPSEVGYYNEFVAIAKAALKKAEKAEKAEAKAAEKAAKEAAKKAEREAKEAIKAAEKKAAEATKIATIDYQNGKLSLSKFTARLKEIKAELTSTKEAAKVA